MSDYAWFVILLLGLMLIAAVFGGYVILVVTSKMKDLDEEEKP